MTAEGMGIPKEPSDAGPCVRGAILALDYGRSRIGMAIAEASTLLAKPLDTLKRVNRNEDMRRLRELVREHAVRRIVVGLPLRLDGTRGEMAEEAERFARRVQKQVGVTVELLDERLTSWEAERLLEETQGRRLGEDKPARATKRKKAGSPVGVDAVAAAVILTEYLERQRQFTPAR